MSWTLATFNVNGIRARMPILLDWLAKNSPEVVCLQETKVQDQDFPAAQLQEAGYVANFHGQKSFNGVAILSKAQPDEVIVGLDDGAEDGQARVISAKLRDTWVINTYMPQGQEVASEAFSYKLAYFQRLRGWLDARFKPDEKLVWTGDINVAPTDLDVFDPKRMAGKVGCHPDERAALEKVASWGLSDMFRRFHPEERQFTFWDYRLPKSFQRNLGWRIDLIMASRPLAQGCGGCTVDTEPRGLAKPSDHTPVLAVFD